MRWTLSIVVVWLAALAPSDRAAAPAGGPVAAAGGTVTGKIVVFRDGKPVALPADVWVYLKPQKRAGRTPKPRKDVIAQRNIQFVPRVKVVPLGSVIAFPNNDKEEHNVFSPVEPVFDLKRYNGGQSNDHSFLDAGEYDIYCDIHKDMSAKVKVVDSDYIGPVQDGTFSLTGVPPGSYKVVAWAPDSQEVTSRETVVVTEGAVARVPFELHLALGSPKPSHVRKDGTLYRDTAYDRHK